MILFADDPGSLERLHDIVEPPPVPWWPPAPGWYVLAALLFVLVALLVWRAVVWWLQTRYRRAALAELARFEGTSTNPGGVPALAELVKRVALVGFPREQVASLSGQEWLAFLDRSGRTDAFTRGAGQTLEDGYKRGAQPSTTELIAVVRQWIKYHRISPPC